MGVILSNGSLAKLGVEKGDTLNVVDQPDGVPLTVSDPDFEAQMAEERVKMKKWRHVVDELAK